jgi:hypothetical protein
MGHAILSGLGVDPDTLPDFGRIVIIEGENLLEAFDRQTTERVKERVANWPDYYDDCTVSNPEVQAFRLAEIRNNAKT